MRICNSIYIAFRNAQVAVRSHSAEFLENVRSLFQHLLVSEPTQIIEQFEIDEKGGKFYLSGSGEIEHGTLAEIVCRFKYEVITCFVRSCSDLLWFHAGAVAYHDRAILLPGAGGRGKSTLVSRLCAQGWRYLSEDVVALDLKSGVVFPFPQSPRVRENVGRQLPHEQVLMLNKIQVQLPPEAVCFQALPIQAVIFPHYAFQAVDKLKPCSLGTAILHLFENCMNFSAHQHTAFGDSYRCLKHAASYDLPFSDRDRATRLIIEACTSQACLS